MFNKIKKKGEQKKNVSDELLAPHYFHRSKTPRNRLVNDLMTLRVTP